MTDSDKQLARREEVGLEAPSQKVIEVAGQGEVQRHEVVVTLPEIYQYAIARYGSAPKVMITSDGYDYINRTMGVQLYQPDWVNDENGERVRNPIHRPDYLYLRMYGIWHNDIGQMTSYREDVEVDFKLVYMDARINSRSAKVEMDEDGQPKFSASGMPIVKLSAEDELKAMKALSQLRTFGLRYAQTVAKTRILKTASSIRTLPISTPQKFTIRVVGYKDNLTPDQRIKQAQTDLTSMFGKGTLVDDETGLTPDELEQFENIEATDVTEDIERQLVDEAVKSQGEVIEPEPVSAKPTRPVRRVGPDDFGQSEGGNETGS